MNPSKDEFLVTTTVEGKTWQVLWDPEENPEGHGPEPLALDFPVFWELHSTDTGFVVKHKADGRTIALSEAAIEESDLIPLPLNRGEPRQISIQLKRLKKIRPAFIPDLSAFKNIGPADHYASSGIRDLLINFVQVEKNFKAQVENIAIFEMKVVSTGFQVTAFQKNLRFKLSGQKSRLIPVGQPVHIATAEVHGGAFIIGSYWWRINKVAKPQLIDPQDFADEERVQDSVPVSVLGKICASLFLAFILISRGSYYLEQFQDKKPKVEQAQVELKKPKIIPMEIAKRPEPPKPPEKKKEPPKEIVKKEPPKPKKKEVVKKEPPKKKETKVVKKEPPKKLPPVAKAPPKPLPKTPPPKMVAKAPTPKAPPAPAAPALPRKAPPVVAQVPNPAIQKAKQQAQEKAALAKSLNFLSASPSKNVAAFATVPGAAVSAKYNDLGAGAVSGTTKGGASALNKMADSNVGGDGVIATRGARSVAGVGLAGSHGKGLNEVQGKVSLSALYGNGSGDELASAAGGAGMNVSGPGKISDAAIEKTLAKYLQKFQYCYEKALLTDSTLAGTIRIQWTIQMGGGVNEAHVIQSAMNNPGLHACLTRELSKIVFPSPVGGSVVVKKPFAFQSSTL